MLLPGYDAEKAAHVAAYFALKEGGSINVLKVSKLLYLSEREFMTRYDEPMFYDRLVSMPDGPCTSITLNLINGNVADKSWPDLVKRENYSVNISKEINNASDLDRLSRADIEVLDLLWAKFGHMDQWQIRDWTHVKENVPEWQDPHGSSNSIPYVRVYSALNKADPAHLSALVQERRHVAEAIADL